MTALLQWLFPNYSSTWLNARLSCTCTLPIRQRLQHFWSTHVYRKNWPFTCRLKISRSAEAWTLKEESLILEQFTGSQAEREKVLTFFYLFIIFFCCKFSTWQIHRIWCTTDFYLKKESMFDATFRASKILINKFNNDFQRDKEKLNPWI